jgi:hypothetical protein
MKQYINPLLKAGSLLALLFTIYQQYNRINELKPQAALVDSLQTELFIKQTEVGRYEMALEELKEKDSKAAKKFEIILQTVTE